MWNLTQSVPSPEASGRTLPLGPSSNGSLRAQILHPQWGKALVLPFSSWCLCFDFCDIFEPYFIPRIFFGQLVHFLSICENIIHKAVQRGLHKLCYDVLKWTNTSGSYYDDFPIRCTKRLKSIYWCFWLFPGGISMSWCISFVEAERPQWWLGV